MSFGKNKVSSLLLGVGLWLSVAFFLSGCGGTSTVTPPQASGITATQGTPATTLAGDIPDTQAFVKYQSPQGGYELEVPEGWAQTVVGTGVNFADKFNSVQVQLSPAKSAPTVESVRSNEVVTLQKSGNSVQNVNVQSIQVNGDTAILITYTANSDANAVTGKQVPLDNNRYLFFHNGKLATVTFSAPLGADNVDQWARMSRSFRWV